MSSSSSYQDLIISTITTSASKNELNQAIENLVIFDEQNNISSGKLKSLFDSMNLPGTDVTSVRSDLDKIVQLDDSGNIDSNGSGFLNSIQNRLTLIQSTLPVIQESIRNLETRIKNLEPITSLFTWANDGQVDIVNLQEEYTQTFKSNTYDVSTYGVSVSITGNWSIGYGKVVDSMIEFNPTLNGTYAFSGININYGGGLKVNEDTTVLGYIKTQNDISLYDSTGTNPIENIDFTFDQIDFDNSYQLTHVTQSFLPSLAFSLSDNTIATLDPNITFKIDDVDVQTFDNVIIDDINEITANEFLVAV